MAALLSEVGKEEKTEPKVEKKEASADDEAMSKLLARLDDASAIEKAARETARIAAAAAAPEPEPDPMAALLEMTEKTAEPVSDDPFAALMAKLEDQATS